MLSKLSRHVVLSVRVPARFGMSVDEVGLYSTGYIVHPILTHRSSSVEGYLIKLKVGSYVAVPEDTIVPDGTV